MSGTVQSTGTHGKAVMALIEILLFEDHILMNFLYGFIPIPALVGQISWCLDQIYPLFPPGSLRRPSRN
jgi:hypothetical protein